MPRVALRRAAGRCLRRDEERGSEEEAWVVRVRCAVGLVDCEGGRVGRFERRGDAGAPGSVGVGGVAEEGCGWGGEEGGVEVGYF